MQSLQNKRLLLGITGGIAAYKTPDLVRRLRDCGAEVKVVMTKGACEFITPLTLQAVSGNRVHTGLLDAEAEAAMGHIELARWADAIVVAPATSDVLARLSVGRADDLLTTLVRASTAPLLLAPAMNQAMWADKATQQSYQSLVELGVHFIGPESGSQACGDTGFGRMSEPMAIVHATAALFETYALSGKQVLITAGPTREALDPVRYLSNYSSGKMGFALAEAAIESGAKVILIAGPVDLPSPERVTRIDVTSAEEMLTAVNQQLGETDIFIAAAAVADYRPKTIQAQKVKKIADIDSISLDLVKNPDILATVVRAPQPIFTVGFAAETEKMIDHARDKMARKGIDMIVANDVSRSDIGFGSEVNEVTVLYSDQTIDPQELEICSKTQLARQLVSMIANRVNEI